MKAKKTKDGIILVCKSKKEAKTIIAHILQGILKESHEGENRFGERPNPYDTSQVPGFRHSG